MSTDPFFNFDGPRQEFMRERRAALGSQPEEDHA
jgi:hypothetical protein